MGGIKEMGKAGLLLWPYSDTAEFPSKQGDGGDTTVLPLWGGRGGEVGMGSKDSCWAKFMSWYCPLVHL